MDAEVQPGSRQPLVVPRAEPAGGGAQGWHAPRVRSGNPVVQIDVAAVLGGFLKELSPIDVVVELIQNELDAGSTSTEIVFGEDALVCTGNGRRIEPEGWKRLVYVLGAGGEVAAKEDGIGAKNHGIRAGFLLGDDIVVQCQGYRAELTLRGDGRDRSRFFPAAWPRERDDAAPARGTRVSVGYRREVRKVPGHNPLMPPDPSSLDLLFDGAVQTSPNRFLFASAPGRSWEYELVLVRGARRVVLRYQAKPAGKGGLFLRTCTRSEGARSRRIVERKLCSVFSHELAPGDNAKVPRLYRRGGGIVGEIGWSCDFKGRPVPGSGELRYPIAFPAADIRSRSGFDISAPFVAGRARHSLGEDERNENLLEAAREKIVELTRAQLTPRFGPDALRLLSNTAQPDSSETQILVRRLHAVGGFPVFEGEERGGPDAQSFALSSPGTALLLPTPTYAVGRLDRGLAALARGAGEVLHPRCPDFIIAALRLLDQTNVRQFDELDAARLVFIAQAPPQGEAEGDWLRRCMAAVKLLELARMHETLDRERLGLVASAGRLPDTEGKAAPWTGIQRAKHRPPPVPGTAAPRLLHPALMDSAIFKDGPGAVEPFRINPYLSKLDFSGAPGAARGSFFKWLRRSHGSLHPKTLVAIARYPIWPGADGMWRPLADYCWPRAPYLRAILTKVGAAPAEALISFPGLGASSTSSLRLRRTPTVDELRTWHSAAMAMVKALLESDADAARELIHSVEANLDRLRLDKFAPREVAPFHLSVSRSGAVRPIAELHVDSAVVLSCDLRAIDLAIPNRRTLYQALNAPTHPLPAALLGALREKPDASRLAQRLSAYRGAGRSLTELSEEAIIPVGDELLRPDQLAFPSTTDYWGEWKRKLPFADRSPDAIRLLEEVGIIRASLREEHSRAFFSWLAWQSLSCRQRHLSQIVRHWADGRAGPQRWASTMPGASIIPARDGAGRFWLLPLSEATRVRPSVYVADFPEIQERVLADNPKVKLAISEHPDVDGSTLHALRACGVRSLRLEAGRPLRLTIAGESSSSSELDAELARLQSPAILRLLPRLLPQHDVRAEHLERSWRRLIKDIKGARIAEGLMAVHGILRREYPARMSSGFDETTAQICVAAGSNQVLGFYEAVALRIFEAGSPAAYAYGLLRAVNDPVQADMFAALEPEAEPREEQPANADRREGDDPAQRHKGHGLPADVKPFAPDPKPLDRLTSLTFTKGAKKHRKLRQPAATDAQRHSLEEDAQINKLKNQHYAVHCQACIGRRDISEVAPPETYVFSPHYRRSMIHAHHVEHLQNQAGGQGAQNLLMLCRYHHAQLGDQLTRHMVIGGLRSATKVRRNFPAGKDGALVEREGLAATVTLPLAPHEVVLYFTRDHADAWLDG